MESFNDLRIAANLDLHGVADFVGVSITTVYRWRRTDTIPPPAARLLRARSGDLGALDETWAGWKLRPGTLITPCGYEARQGDIRALHWLLQIAFDRSRESRQERRGAVRPLIPLSIRL